MSVQIVVYIFIAFLIEEIVHSLLSGQLQEHVVDQVLRGGLLEAFLNFWDAQYLLFRIDIVLRDKFISSHYFLIFF